MVAPADIRIAISITPEIVPADSTGGQGGGVDNPAELQPPVVHGLQQVFFGPIWKRVLQALEGVSPIGVQRRDLLLVQLGSPRCKAQHVSLVNRGVPGGIQRGGGRGVSPLNCSLVMVPLRSPAQRVA
jgi:hypothetical protein